MDNLATKFLTVIRNPGLGKRPLARQIGVSPNTALRYRTIAETFELDADAIARLGDSGLARLVRAPAGETTKIEPAWNEVLVKLQNGSCRRSVYDQFSRANGAENIIVSSP